jgi:tetratricopeptide (TPR) repeat protein
VIVRLSKLSSAARRQRFRLLWLAVLVGVGGLGCFLLYPPIIAQQHFRAAEKALADKRLPEAREHLDVCQHAWPRSPAVQFLIARVARLGGFYEEADRRLDNCKRLNGPVEQIELERALLRVQQGGMTRSMELALLRYVEQDHHADSVFILEALSQGCLRTYRNESAILYLTKLLELKADDAHVLLTRGWVYDRMSNWENARNDYTAAQRLTPDNQEALLRLARALVNNGQPVEAMAHFQELHERDPDNAVAGLGLAQCLHKLGRFDEEEKLLDALLAKPPRKPEIVLQRGDLALQRDQPVLAEPLLREAVKLDAFDYQAHYSLAQCLRKLAKESEAGAEFDRAKEVLHDRQRLSQLTDELQYNPYEGSLPLRVELAQIFLRSGQERESILWLQGALQIDSGYRPALQMLAELYEKKGQSALARDYRERAEQPGK